MKTKTPKRLGMKRNFGRPVYLMRSLIESGSSMKSIPFSRKKVFAR